MTSLEILFLTPIINDLISVKHLLTANSTLLCRHAPVKYGYISFHQLLFADRKPIQIAECSIAACPYCLMFKVKRVSFRLDIFMLSIISVSENVVEIFLSKKKRFENFFPTENVFVSNGL